ncbi:MAG TPA: GNAT family acetyltransferase [Dehalococcoidales bacterium]|nr:GNAT family acetyltransferase [Dehalococcoidales bacterium]
MQITTYKSEYEKEVIALWQRCNLTRPQNNPQKDIERKLKVNPELFLVGLDEGKVMATVMGNYDGHRGWIYYLGVEPALQMKGYGRQMVGAMEEKLRAMGCPKINLQVRKDNMKAVKFYENIGFKIDEVMSMGKRLEED